MGRTIITQPLDRIGDFVNQSEPGLNRFCHQIPDHIPTDTSRGGHVAHDLTITTFHAEGYPNPFTIPTGYLEGIRTPSHVAADHPDSSVVNSHGSPRMTLQQQIALLHDPIHPLVIDAFLVFGFEHTIHYSRHPSVSIGCPRIYDRTYQGQVSGIIGLMIKTLAPLGLVVVFSY
jgi:hypothetical protein